MKTIAIISALESEQEYFREQFKPIKKDKFNHYEIYVSEFEDKKIINCVCGIGKVNSAALTQRIIDMYNPDLVINCGVCGGLDKTLSFDEVILADKLKYHDINLDIFSNNIPYTDTFEADPETLKKLDEIMTKENLKHRIGLIVTGDQFISTTEKQEELFEKYHALGTEMEGCSIAHTCYLNDVKFLVIRSLSDFADDDADDEFYNDLETKTRKAAHSVVVLIKNM